MASAQDLAERRIDMLIFDPRKLITEEGWNAREPSPDLERHIEELKGSIKELGVQEPLTIYMHGDSPVVTNGHCRLEAVRRLIAEGMEIKTVPVRLEDRKANEADRVLSLITRNAGKPLRPIETAGVLKRLSNYGWSTKEIAAKTGISSSYVGELLNLLAAPPAVLDMVRAGEVSATRAGKAVRKHGENAPQVINGAKDKALSESPEQARDERQEIVRKSLEETGQAELNGDYTNAMQVFHITWKLGCFVHYDRTQDLYQFKL